MLLQLLHVTSVRNRAASLNGHMSRDTTGAPLLVFPEFLLVGGGGGGGGWLVSLSLSLETFLGRAVFVFMLLIEKSPPGVLVGREVSWVNVGGGGEGVGPPPPGE